MVRAEWCNSSAENRRDCSTPVHPLSLCVSHVLSKFHVDIPSGGVLCSFNEDLYANIYIMHTNLTVCIDVNFVVTMDVLLNGHRISAKGELCCMMGKTMSLRCYILAANGWRLAKHPLALVDNLIFQKHYLFDT